MLALITRAAKCLRFSAPARRSAKPQALALVSAVTLAVFGSTVANAQEKVAEILGPPAIADVRIGFDGVYKLGCWTQLTVTLRGGAEPAKGRITATLPDTDGVATTVSTPASAPVEIGAAKPTTVNLFIRPGQQSGELTIRLLDADGHEVASRRFDPTPIRSESTTASTFPQGFPATARLAILVGARQGLATLFQPDEEDDPATATHAVNLTHASDLPTEWYAYEGVDTVILCGSQPKLYADLAADSPRVAALARWVELGGRLVVFCGKNASELLAEGKPLAGLIPGRFTELGKLDESTPLEAFAGNAPPLDRRRLPLAVPQLADVTGAILAFPGQNSTDLPVVIRARRGLGEIAFAGVDLDEPPLDSWPGRMPFLRRMVGWTDPPLGAESPATRGAASAASADLAGHLRTALDSHFAGVTTIPFGWVALLVGTYVALIGPGDMFFLQRVLRRMEATWITFPLVVVATSAAAYGLAQGMKGKTRCAAQLEIVDCDLTTGATRGTVFTHLFNPRVDRFDLAVDARFGKLKLHAISEPGRPDPGGPQVLASYLGLPGVGLGAMQGERVETSLFADGYRYAENGGLLGLPIEQWSTKTITARWTATVDRPLDAKVDRLADDLLFGRITNHTGVPLTDCVLLHGKWAYVLPQVADGGSLTIDDHVKPRTVKLALASARSGDAKVSRVGEDGAVPYDPYGVGVARIAKLMMFDEALGGTAYAPIPNRYQHQLDLSRLLTGDQAIMLARAPDTAGSRWLVGSSADLDAKTTEWTYYRFVIPLTRPREVIVPRQ